VAVAVGSKKKRQRGEGREGVSRRGLFAKQSSIDGAG
jgi:hypothetical protein